MAPVALAWSKPENERAGAVGGVESTWTRYDRTASTLSPLARSLLESTPAPVSRRADRVALTMLVPSDTVFVGQQVDLIAAAWIPRDLGERMRRPPLLTLVTPEGVWAYPMAASSGVSARMTPR